MNAHTRQRLIIALALAGIGVAVFYPDNPFSIGPPSAGDLRADAMALCALYLPCNRGDAHYREICKDFGGSGTTCGYLPAWLWDRLGCRDPRLVNRADAAQGLVYRQGMNISDVVNGGKADAMWRLYHPGGAPPEPGDVLYFGVVGQDGGITHEHVAVLKSWPAGGVGQLVTYDLGHSGNPEGSESTRTLHADGTVSFLGSLKTLVGIDNLAMLPVTAPPDLTDHTIGVS